LADELLTKPEMPLPSVQTWASFYSSPDDYPQVFSGEEAQKIRKKLSSLATGSLAALPLLCAGPTCPFALKCPFQEVGKAPLNLPCLVEASLLREWVVGYLVEYEVTMDSLTDRYLIQELVELELLNFRINSILSLPEHAHLSVEENIAYDRQGNVLTRTVVNGLLELKLKLGARKDKIIKSLVGDRQEKYRKQAALKTRSEGDSSSKMSEMRKSLEKLQRELKQLQPAQPDVDPIQEVMGPDEG
jgi:hypothetical protein